MSAASQPRETSMRVLVLSSDRRFRQVVSLLLERRGCAVFVGQERGTLAERVDRERTDVVVIDACRSLAAAARMRAAVDALSRPVGVVIVGEEDQSELLELQAIVAKWGPFERLFEAVERSYRERVGSPPFAGAVEGAEPEPLGAEPLSA